MVYRLSYINNSKQNPVDISERKYFQLNFAMTIIIKALSLYGICFMFFSFYYTVHGIDLDPDIICSLINKRKRTEKKLV